MKVVGRNSSVNSQGLTVTTLHTTSEFDSYYTNKEAGRSCTGVKAETIYVGTYDCSAIKVGDEIDILYDKAVATAKGGVYQPINSRVIRDINEFKKISDVIVANRYSEAIADVLDKVYTRDLYFRD